MKTLALVCPGVIANGGGETVAYVIPCPDYAALPPNFVIGSVPAVTLVLEQDNSILIVTWIYVILEGYLCSF